MQIKIGTLVRFNGDDDIGVVVEIQPDKGGNHNYDGYIIEFVSGQRGLLYDTDFEVIPCK